MTKQQNIEKLEKEVKEFFNCKLSYTFEYEITHSRSIVTHTTNETIEDITGKNSVIHKKNTIIDLFLVELSIEKENGEGRVYTVDEVKLTELFKNVKFTISHPQNKQIIKQVNNILKIQILTHVIVHDILPYSNNQSKT